MKKPIADRISELKEQFKLDEAKSKLDGFDLFEKFAHVIDSETKRKSLSVKVGNTTFTLAKEIPDAFDMDFTWESKDYPDFQFMVTPFPEGETVIQTYVTYDDGDNFSTEVGDHYSCADLIKELNSAKPNGKKVVDIYLNHVKKVLPALIKASKGLL